MQTSLRLYSPYDNDLIALRIIEGRRFSKLVRDSIRACVNNEPYVIHVPQNLYKYVYESNDPFLVNLTFNGTDDEKVICLLSNLKRGTANTILKTMIRSRLDSFPSGAFLPEELREAFPVVKLRNSAPNDQNYTADVDPEHLYRPKKDSVKSIKKQEPSDSIKKEDDSLRFNKNISVTEDKKTEVINDHTLPPSDVKTDIPATIPSTFKAESVSDISKTQESFTTEDNNDDIFSMLENIVNH